MIVELAKNEPALVAQNNRSLLDDRLTVHSEDAKKYIKQKLQPYDVIIITGALATLPSFFKPQLMRKGKLFAIIGQAPALEGALYTLNKQDQWQKKLIFNTLLPPLITPTPSKKFLF